MNPDENLKEAKCGCAVERRVRPPIEDLKAFAGSACIDIFNDFDENEITRYSRSIRQAWDIGRQLAEAA